MYIVTCTILCEDGLSVNMSICIREYDQALLNRHFGGIGISLYCCVSSPPIFSFPFTIWIAGTGCVFVSKQHNACIRANDWQNSIVFTESLPYNQLHLFKTWVWETRFGGWCYDNKFAVSGPWSLTHAFTPSHARVTRSMSARSARRLPGPRRTMSGRHARAGAQTRRVAPPIDRRAAWATALQRNGKNALRVQGHKMHTKSTWRYCLVKVYGYRYVEYGRWRQWEFVSRTRPQSGPA